MLSPCTWPRLSSMRMSMYPMRAVLTSSSCPIHYSTAFTKPRRSRCTRLFSWAQQRTDHAWGHLLQKQTCDRFQTRVRHAKGLASASVDPNPKGFGNVLSKEKKKIHQAMDFTAVAASIAAMRSWIPSRVEEVIQWDKSCVALRLRVPDSQGWLHFSWDPQGARFCMGHAPQRGSISEAFSFGERLHAGLRGLILMEVVLPVAYERVVQFKFGKRQEGEMECSVWCEIMGKYSNLLLVDSSSTILLCARQVGAKLSSIRSLQDGGLYSLPCAQNGLSPEQPTSEDEWINIIKKSSEAMQNGTKSEGKGVTVASSMTRSFQGVSPSLCHELMELSSIGRTTLVNEMVQQNWTSLFQQWMRWLDILKNGDFKPSFCSSSGRYSVLGAYDEPQVGVHELFDEFYKNYGDEDHFGKLHQQLSSCVKRHLKKLSKKVIQLEKAMQDAQEAAQSQKQADLIMANIHKWEKGLSEMTVEDWESGDSVTIKLDPTKTGVESAQRLYNKSKKQKRSVDVTASLLELAKGELDYMQEAEESLRQLNDHDEEGDMQALEEIKEDLINLKYMKLPKEQSLAAKAASRSKKGRKKGAKTVVKQGTGQDSYRVANSPNGFRVLIGRNSRQNDQLSKTVAKDDDFWFHARGMPGSHVVLKLDGKGEAPEKEDFVFAAEAAAWFSKGRESGSVGVIKTLGKHVSKPKGAPPGLVQVSREEIVVVQPRNVVETENLEPA